MPFQYFGGEIQNMKDKSCEICIVMLHKPGFPLNTFKEVHIL